MASKNTAAGKQSIITTDLFGRRTIYSSVERLTEDNVVSEVNSALVYHFMNMAEEERLYWYRRGIQPILMRQKKRNKFILNLAVENHADQIVSFKNGYFLTQNAVYISRNDEAQEKVNALNEYLYRSGKNQADNEVVDWFHTVGKAALFIEPNDDPDVPFLVYALRPMGAFVAYSLTPGNEPVYGVNTVCRGDRIFIDVWTEDALYRLSGAYKAEMATAYPDRVCTAVQLDAVEPNILGHIPIIEYQYNAINTGAFEIVIGLLDELNNILSNRCDGIEQFIQSLMVIYNSELPDGENARSIKEQGILELKSIGEVAARVEILSEQLDQSQTQTLVNDIYQKILEIAAMPSRANGSSTYDTTGAAVLANFGWYQADAAARNTEDLFRKSNRRFDRIVVDLLRRKQLLDISINDFELNFVRNETANIQSKAQAFQTLMAAGMHPELAAGKSGVSNDPVSDVKMSEKYLKMRWGDPEKPTAQPEEVIVESDRFTGDNETGGAV